jgi:hypothetical protein
MTGKIHNRANDFHWNPINFSLAFMVGVVAIAALWLFAGLMLMLFLM